MSAQKPTHESVYAHLPYVAALTTYLGYAVLIVFGHVRDFAGKLFCIGTLAHRILGQRDGRAPLLSDFEDFYTRRLYLRIQDCWGRPIRGTAGAWINVLERVQERAWSPVPERSVRPYRTLARVAQRSKAGREGPTDPTGNVTRCLNLGSYNYLGYAEVPGGVHQSVRDVLRGAGVAACDVAVSTGRSQVVRELEATVAEFLGKEAAFVVGMGFATNSQIIPAIVGKGDLILSDALNHASIVVGARSSGAKIRTFEHNSAKSLDEMIRDAVATGQPVTCKPWNRILVVIEGMYSMEGEACKLREIVAVKKKYGAYLYLDEAHSIGALGPTGRGVAEHHGINPSDIDIMMGTFTKSFGAVGGYIATSAALVERIRALSAASLYASAMAPPCAQHILWAFNQMAGKDGTGIGAGKIRALRVNAIYFREQLRKMGVQTLGDWDSPVIPIMLYNPAKIAAFSRECYKRGLAVVVVGFPATPLLLSRARICLSAAHTREDLDWALGVIDQVAEIIQIKYDRSLLHRVLPKAVSRLLVRGGDDV
ncbi:serine palmitoyltransferase, LCB2 subunit [Chondrus crispus]|uniref:serine C-palmitoyltransferase n=1 Tax=Chondrus crispus TaxID=2769 RepID=R7QR28_CHOCR|nr:serine palmitoyltransferase, LCB2 subunit [Chondrus crispus]CDF39840.1 serine palmitoyltransferase, LCB2 subunit [Chondrus crispus]|eukprot:XP_005710134.1 serine palmitoyltransferase, LCB2 subunit [Chondrus crispus]